MVELENKTDNNVEELTRCKKCGTENAKGSQFCSKCGKTINSKNKNYYARILTCLLPFNIIFIIVAIATTNPIMVFINIGLVITQFVLSILSLVKSSKIKRDTNKGKGTAIAIVTIVISVILFLLQLFLCWLMFGNSTDFVNQINGQNVTNTSLYDSLSNSEKEALEGLKILYASANDEESIKVNSILIEYNIYINYSGKNAYGGTVKNCLVYTGHDMSNRNETSWHTTGTKLDKDKIINVYNSLYKK